MFELLTRILLVALFGGIIWYILRKVIPPIYYTGLGALVLVAFLVYTFLRPAEGAISTIWSVLSFPLKPLGLAILLLGSALRTWKKSVSTPQVFAALLILLVSSLPIVPYLLSQQLEQDIIRLTPPPTEASDVIVLLARGTTEARLPPRTQVQLTGSGNRILLTNQLFQERLRATGRPPTVIVSAGQRGEVAGPAAQTTEARDVQTVLINLGIPADRIILEPDSVDIRTSAVEVNRLLTARNLGKRITLVTSALEIRRARLAFAKEGMTVIPRATNFVTVQSEAGLSRRLQVTDFLPSAEALVVTTRIIDEYLLSIFYFLRGWLSSISL